MIHLTEYFGRQELALNLAHYVTEISHANFVNNTYLSDQNRTDTQLLFHDGVLLTHYYRRGHG